MTDNVPRDPTQPRELGARSRFGWAVRLSLVVMCVGFLVSVFREAQRECPFVTWDDLQGRIEMPVDPDSPGVQLVGNMTLTRRYGMFHSGPPSTCASGVTVLYEDHHYFFVETAPDGFFRSLIDKSRFPHIAIDPLERHPIRATSAKSAVAEATRLLKDSAKSWD